jgi:hypothetical protein
MKIKTTDRKRVIVPSIICLILVVLGLYLTDWVVETARLLKYQQKQSEIIVKKSKVDYKAKQRLLQEAKVSQAVIEAQQLEIYKYKLKDTILLKYKRWGLIQQYPWMTPPHIKNCIDYCFKYYPVVNGERIVDKVDLPLMMIAICYHETNFNPDWVYDKNKNKTKDFGITQINSECLPGVCCLLPAEFKKRDLKFDPEVNIYGRYVWIKQRRAYGWSWLGEKFSKRGWEFYGMLQSVR